MKEPTMKEIEGLVDFQRNVHGHLYVHTVNARVYGDVVGDVNGSVNGNVKGNVEGSVKGNVIGSVHGCVSGNVGGTINGRDWQFIETPKEKVIRLIREGRGEEAIMALEESE